MTRDFYVIDKETLDAIKKEYVAKRSHAISKEEVIKCAAYLAMLSTVINNALVETFEVEEIPENEVTKEELKDESTAVNSEIPTGDNAKASTKPTQYGADSNSGTEEQPN